MPYIQALSITHVCFVRSCACNPVFMSAMENHPLFHSLSVTMKRLGTEAVYCLILRQMVLGSTDGIRSVPNSVPILSDEGCLISSLVLYGHGFAWSLQDDTWEGPIQRGWLNLGTPLVHFTQKPMDM
ncbi:hypothetical protein GOODEAATRI_033536 [Goodea atripinnis]|uniref:Uncharacterized protein n=1 Tax=Goodea atripinnis TaxID=208336 RepID=A0ABV0NFU1_9TELE